MITGVSRSGSLPTTRAMELVVFAHGIRNFAHNPGTLEAQERLLRRALRARHDLRGVFDDSGNFAFSTAHDPGTLGTEVLAALNREYKVRGVVVVKRQQLADVIAKLERVTRARFGSSFQKRDWSVSRPSGRWRLGLVLIEQGTEQEVQTRERLERLRDDRLEVLFVEGAVVGVVKYDPHKPRIPWGMPAGLVESALKGILTGVATGRSARTVLGVLGLFERPHRPRGEPARDHTTGERQKRARGGGDKIMQPHNSKESFEQLESWLRTHPELRKAGEVMHEAFIGLARQVWEDSQGQIVPRRAGKNERHVPFSRRGKAANLADTRVRRGAIRLALKIPAAALQSIDGNLSTIPIQQKGRWQPYPRAFDFRDPNDVGFAARLVLACVPRLEGSREVFQQEEPPGVQEPELDFGFVRDTSLRNVLQRDWQECGRVHDAAAWKSYVILCGGLVEGLLVDALARDEMAAKRQFVIRGGEPGVPRLNRWPFDALVRVARVLKFLSFERAAQCQSLRVKRNLVHPACAAAATSEVTREAAAQARRTLRDCYRELQERLSS